MSFALFTDGCSNLPGRILARHNIRLLPCTYILDGQTVVYNGDVDHFDSHTYYDSLRAGKSVSTSLINTQQFLDGFRPALEEGLDVVYVGLSGSVSGTVQAATMAAEELQEEFPGRRVRVVDSLGASLGVGLLTCRGDQYRQQGLSANETADRLLSDRMKLAEYFTVADLNFLRRTGRVSAATAALGAVLNIKPMLRGDEKGYIVAATKCRGRKRAVEAMVAKYKELVVDPRNEMVAISHGDCPEEAEALAELLRQAAPEPKEFLIVPHEPFTGAHSGPGMLGLYFFGKSR